MGVLLLGYPSISDVYYQMREASVAEETAAAVEEQPGSALEEELSACYGYNERLAGSHTLLTDPFDSSALQVTEGEYAQRLDLAGNGVMAEVEIPSIGVSLPLYHTTEDSVLEHGIGHVEASSLPSGGTSSHCVVAGHDGLVSMRVFDDLPKVSKDDFVFVRVCGEVHAYRVYKCETVLPTETDSLVVEQGRDLLTLITCVPYGVNSHRLLVHAERCEVPDWYWDDDAAERAEPIDWSPVIAVATGIAAAALVAAYIVGRARHGKGSGQN